MNGQTFGQMKRCMDKWTDGQTNGQTEGQTDGRNEHPYAMRSAMQIVKMQARLYLLFRELTCFTTFPELPNLIARTHLSLVYAMIRQTLIGQYLESRYGIVMIHPLDGQPLAGLSATRGLATLKAYLVFYLVMLFCNMVCLTVALARFFAFGSA